MMDFCPLLTKSKFVGLFSGVHFFKNINAAVDIYDYLSFHQYLDFTLSLHLKAIFTKAVS